MLTRREATITHLIQQIKHGCGFPFNRFSPYQPPNIVASIIGVGVGLAGLYIALREGKLGSFEAPWTVEKRSSSEIFCYVAGLQNVGNNCFLNVILQALASCSSVHTYLQNILLADDVGIEEKSEEMPLIVSLTSLLEELCIIREQTTVLSPRKVMHTLGSYVSNFKLTRQQDAAEALLHVLSSLEEEISLCYVPNEHSLAHISASPCRIYEQNRKGQNEFQRWQRHFFGPFDGTIGSILTCKSCSNTLSMDFEVFHCLPLSPVRDRSSDIMYGCSLVDCLKHFTAVELVENYRCARCWHIAALRYLSVKKEKDEEKLKRLGECVKVDSCDCRTLIQEEITWTGFSFAVKQLSIAHSPKILCLHLQRASIDAYDELIKLQGHISFPLLLDLFPFMEASLTIEEETSADMQKPPKKHQQQQLMAMPRETPMMPHICKVVGKNSGSEYLSRNKFGKLIFESSDPSSDRVLDDSCREKTIGSEVAASDLNCPQASSACKPQSMIKSGVMKIGSSHSSKCCMYRLSSVVVHYGRSGSGHYAVYRRVASKTGSGDCVGVFGKSQWLYISDHEVSNVSEESVLAAEASLLFYEKIEPPL